MGKKKRKSKADGTPTFRCLNHGGKRKGAGRKPRRHADGPAELANGMRSLNGTITKALNERLGRKRSAFAHRFHLHVLRTKTEVRNAVRYVLRNAEHHGLHDPWREGVGPVAGGPGSSALPRPDPMSTAAWFPYWAERELVIAPTQLPASVVRPAQCFLMKLAFEDAPLSFVEPMGRTSTPKAPRGKRKGPTMGPLQRKSTPDTRARGVMRQLPRHLPRAARGILAG